MKIFLLCMLCTLAMAQTKTGSSDPALRTEMEKYDASISQMALTNADSTLVMAQEMSNRAVQSQDARYLTLAKNSLGLAYYYKSDYPNAVQHFL